MMEDASDDFTTISSNNYEDNANSTGENPLIEICNYVDDNLNSEQIDNKKSTELSDSDDQDFDIVNRNKSKNRKIRIESESDSDEDTNENENAKKEKENTKFKNLSSLIDSESSEDESQRQKSYSPEKFSKEINDNEVKKGKSNNSKKKMQKIISRKDAMKQIHSETQRLIRESSVSLPYHRPKQRTLEEFLNRKKIGLPLPEVSSMAARVKYSVEIVSKALKEKEKEARSFFVESSDSEAEATDAPSLKQNMNIEETQKLLKVDIQNRQKIIHNASSEFGVSRKLFIDKTVILTPAEPSECIRVSPVEERDGKKPEKECKRHLKDMSVPRKLFDHNFQDCVQIQEGDFKDTISKSDSSATAELSADILENSIENGESMNNSNEINPIVQNFENSSISETPIISNREIGKLNQRHSNLTNREVDKKSSCKLNELEELNGHVMDLEAPEDPSSSKISTKINMKKIKKVALSKVQKLPPKLRGNAGMMIDFSKSSKPNKKAVDNFMDRFFEKHMHVNEVEEKSTGVTALNVVVTTDGVEITNEVLPYKLNVDKIDDNDLNRPGAKLSKLKEDLEKTMRTKKSQAWNQKTKEMEINYEDDDEKNIFEEFNKEKDVMNEESEEDTELEQDDYVLKDKKKKKSEFCDDEAQISEGENLDMEEDEDEDEAESESSEEENEEENDEENDEKKQSREFKKFSRIIQIDDNSNSNDGEVESETIKPMKEPFQRINTDVDIFEDDRDEEELSGISTHSSTSQSCIIPTSGNNRCPLTVASQINDSTQSNSILKEAQQNIQLSTSTSPNPANISQDSKKLVSNERVDNLKGQLFVMETRTEVTDDELMELCSGKFDSDNAQRIDLKGLVNTQSSGDLTESQLINLCSGSFSTQSSTSETNPTSKSNNNDESDNNFRSIFKELVTEKEKKEEESGKCEENTDQWNLKLVLSSNEESDNENNQNEENKIIPKKKVKKKKRVKKLIISDDEDDEQSNESFDEQNSESEFESEEEKFLDYDSEENEVVAIPKKDIKKVAANYLEEEAELSGSDWGSEDENEKELDKYELEEADTEEIDETLMRDQIGKIHARQLLDQDNRDVKMLKELLFDDGELHEDGDGRGRKFRWKNIGKMGFDNLDGSIQNDNEGELIEEEEDRAKIAESAKLSHEKFKFCEELREKEADNICNAIDDELINLGMKVLKKKKENINQSEELSNELMKKKSVVPRSVSELVASSSVTKCGLSHMTMKRGSFLARGEQALAKLANIIKETDTISLAPMNAGNFIFTHKSPSVVKSTQEIDQCDNEEELMGSEKSIKKRKLPLSVTPQRMKRAKIDKKNVI